MNVIYLSEWLKEQSPSWMRRRVRAIVQYQLSCYHADAIAKQAQEQTMREKILKEIEGKNSA